MLCQIYIFGYRSGIGVPSYKKGVYCPRELRFPTITELSRDPEIAPTRTLYYYQDLR